MDQKWEWTWTHTSFFPWFPRTSASRPTNVIMCSTPSHHIAHSCNTVCVWRVAVPLLLVTNIPKCINQVHEWPQIWPGPMPWQRNWRFCFSRGTTVSIFSSEIQLHKTNHVPPPPKHKASDPFSPCVVVWSFVLFLSDRKAFYWWWCRDFFAWLIRRCPFRGVIERRNSYVR